MNEIKVKKLSHWQVIAIYLVIYDAITINFSYFFGLWLRTDFQFSQIPIEYLDRFMLFAPVYTILCIIIYWRMRLYNSIWQFASTNELIRIVRTWALVTLVQIAGMLLFMGYMPISYFLVGSVLQLIFMAGARFSYRLLVIFKERRKRALRKRGRAMIIGAGAAGESIIRELKNSSRAKSEPICIIDDNPNKWGRLIDDVPVVGGRDKIIEAVEDYSIDQILFVIPSATAEDKKNILNICKETDCALQILPGLYQMANGDVSLSSIQPVDINDLLGRDPIEVNMQDILRSLTRKTILVTGGGGSIGSELCRQIAAQKPKCLVIFDIYENNAYDIQQELLHEYPDINLHVAIGSVQDFKRINEVFDEFKPDIVYHAAAHKHVPLMEHSPNEAIKNNVVGTFNTAVCALSHHTDKFVMISTDKAVNPTNVMGCSKRMCEMVIQSLDECSAKGNYEIVPVLSEFQSDLRQDSPGKSTRFVAVRFGNVLNSNGSVIPLFKKQIAEGGPVTVTDPEITRYFMTIPEAVSLVLQAGAYANGGEIFILDMGEPVKIDDLARNLIRLSGFIPDVDIPVVYTGLREGEKLYEEKLMSEEGLSTTANRLIHIAKPINFDRTNFYERLVILKNAAYSNSDQIVDLMKQTVSTFHPAGFHPKKEI